MKKKRSSPSVRLGLVVLIVTAIVVIGGMISLFRDQEKSSMPQSSHVTDELQRAKSLLSPRRINNVSLTEVAANPAPETIGAQGGIGFKANKSDVTFSVYVFEDWDKSSKAVENFSRQYEDDDDVYVATTMNGALVFYGSVRTDTKDGVTKQFQLADFLSAFAGDE